MKKQIEQLKQQLEEKQNQYLRALADYQNLEKRFIQQQEQIQKKQLASFLLKLIELKEDMDKATVFQQDHGLKLILNKVQQILKQYAVTEINPVNQPFSPDTMECIQVESGKIPNQVIKVINKGYLINNELLQPAKVIVSQLEVHPKNQEGKKS